MKLAFYYHVSAYITENNIRLPGDIGIFLDSLAEEVEELFLLLHETSLNSPSEDYTLSSSNIQWIGLGVKKTSWHRVLFHGKILYDLQQKISSCDYLLVRSPSPLAPYFSKYLDHTQLVFLVVGSYREGARHMPTSSLRSLFVKWFTWFMDLQFSRALKTNHVIVNSEHLKYLYQGHVKSLSEIKTTTLSCKDFYHRSDTCKGEVIHLLYTGRLDLAKGLMELVEALISLLEEGLNLHLHFVGWEYDQKRPVETALRQRISYANIVEKVTFHGKKKVGVELNAMYQMADIYVIPSYHEGFPRTIWEALASSLPVIATCVGSIPYFLEDRKSVYLINPRSPQEIKVAIKELIVDRDLRERMIIHGLEKAKQATLEVNSRKIVEILESRI